MVGRWQAFDRMNRMSPAVAALLVLNIVVFAAGLFVPGWQERIRAVGAFWYPDHANFGAWQAVTYMFLHGDLGHIFFNMFALVSFGTVLEREWSWLRFLLFYFFCGVGAALIQLGVNWHQAGELHAQLVAAGLTPATISDLMATGRGSLPADPMVKAVLVDLYQIHAAPMVGASGAIYGLLVAFGCMYPNAKLAMLFIPVPIAAKFFIPALLALDLLSGVTGFSLFGGSIAHFAHLGGATIGFLLVMLWRNPGPRDGLTQSHAGTN